MIDLHSKERMDALHHDAVLIFDQCGSPDLLPLDHFIKRLLQAFRLQSAIAIDIPVHGNMIGGCGIAGLGQYPKALLGI